NLQHYYALRAQTWLAAVRRRLPSARDPSRGALLPARDLGSWPLWLVGAYSIFVLVLHAVLTRDVGQSLLASILLFVLAAITVVNLKTSLILDKLTFSGMAAGLLLTPVLTSRSVLEALGGLVVGGGIFLVLLLVTGGAFGGGTMKMGSMIGAFLGWQLTI